MIIMGVDYGDRRTGIALCDETETLAYPHLTVKAKSMRESIERVAAAALGSGAGALVIGLPLNMDGSEGVRAGKARAFGRVLSRVTQLPVFYQDERLSTVEAERQLSEAGVKKRDRADRIDQAAARQILQEYLECKGQKTPSIQHFEPEGE